MRAKVLLVGPGELGGAVLDGLVREPSVGEVVVAGRDAARAERRCNLSRMIAAVSGSMTPVRFASADLARPGTVADLLRRERPDILFSAASLQTWWLADLLPEAAAAMLRRARFGAWLPVHLAPTLALMQAARDAGFAGVTLAAPYPDVVNCVLGRIGLAPTCGVGNVDEMAAKVAILAAARLGVDPSGVRVRLVAHHALEAHVFGPGDAAARGDPRPPFALRIDHAGRDITAEVAAETLLFSPCPLPAGRDWCRFTAAVVVRFVRALGGADDVPLHAAGPHGLPGGYPVVAGRMRVRVDLPEGPAEAGAIALNERSHQFEGIDRIEPDGTVVFRDEDAEALRAALGYSCGRLAPAEAAPRGQELVDRFRAFARRHGVDLTRAGRA
jgi:hypothetical protein